MKETKIYCDCGCKVEIEKKNPFVLSKKKIFGCAMGSDIDDLKIRGKLYFLNLEHLQSWVNRAVTAEPILRKRIEDSPQFRGSTYERNVPDLYI